MVEIIAKNQVKKDVLEPSVLSQSVFFFQTNDGFNQARVFRFIDIRYLWIYGDGA